MTGQAIWRLSAVEAVAARHADRLGAVQLVEATIARLRTTQGALNAVIDLDDEAVLAAARRLGDMPRPTLPPLADLPILVHDLSHVGGIGLTARAVDALSPHALAQLLNTQDLRCTSPGSASDRRAPNKPVPLRLAQDRRGARGGGRNRRRAVRHCGSTPLTWTSSTQMRRCACMSEANSAGVLA